MTSGPDFLCVGQQKSGTTWLYDQLQFHRSFWMPPVKELQYLSGKYPTAKMRTAIEAIEGAEIRRLAEERKKERMRALDARDFRFFEAAHSITDRPFSLSDYASLFAMKDGKLTGDITPLYFSIADDRLQELNTRWPRVRFILLVRDPVERVWSRINKGFRENTLSPSVLDDAAALTRHVRSVHDNLGSYGTRIAAKYRDLAGAERLHVELFDDIAAAPMEVLARILRYLGAPFVPSLLEPGYNRKRNHEKLAMPDIVRAVLVAQFEQELRDAAAMFGGAAKAWSRRYGL